MIEVVNSLLNPPIGYHGVLAKTLGSVPAAVMLSQGMYWQKVAESKGQEWFWVTADEWYNQTGITEESQKTARRIMKDAGFWNEKLMGLPAKLYFRIDAERLVAVISRYLETGIQVAVDRRNKKPDNTRSSDGKFRQQVAVNNGNEETKEENIEKTNEETTTSAADAPAVELPVEEEKKKKKDAPGQGSAPSWTKTAATIFDEVGAELSKVEGIDYIPFNWKVCNEQNFAHLKNLRKLAIEPDFKNKMGHLPNDEEFFTSFRAVMTLSYRYFRKIQKETNGALHYTPSSIYSSYNKIKNFKNGNTNNNGSLGGQPSKFGQGGNQNGKYDPDKGY